MARADMTVDCVDVNHSALMQMATLYPRDWSFHHDDAWTFAEESRAAGVVWDCVSVDTFTGDAEQRSMASLDLWCALAASLVTATVTTTMRWRAPDGWRGSLFFRSPDVHWLVLRPC